MKLKLDFKVDREKNKDAQSDEQIAVNYLLYVVRQAYEKGMPSDKRRIYSNLLAKAEKAIKTKSEELEINEFEKLFLKDCFSKAVVAPTEAEFVTLVEDALNEKAES